MGKKKHYKLDDGSIVTPLDVCDKYWKIWHDTMSDTLARQRLTYSTDPEYIYSEKGLLVGHEYCKVAKIKKKTKKVIKQKVDHKKYRTGELKQYYDPFFILATAGVTKRYLKLTAKT